MERSFSVLLGMARQGRALKLPSDVDMCPRGNRCCWRWLARGVVEQVSCGTTSGQGLTEAVSSLSQELTALRKDSKECLAAKARCEQDNTLLCQLQHRQREMDSELQDLRCVRDRLDIVQQENESLRTAKDRHASTERGLEKVVSCLQAQHRVLLDGDMAAMRQRAETSEQLLRESEKLREDLAKRCARVEAELQAQRTSNAVLLRSASEAKLPKARQQIAKKKAVPQRGSSSPVRGDRRRAASAQLSRK